MSLTASDFPAFYRAVHQNEPFPWQRDLTAAVLEQGQWPSLVDVPTGMGKTSMLDVAVFLAAATASHGGPDRVGRRRCLFVVDRRTVVDEATEHARRIAHALDGAEAAGDDQADDVVVRAAAALRALGGNGRGPVLTVTRMRGGSTWTGAWSERPDRPGVVVGTVDQVGSRLLFRGYGVGARRRPIEAALVGTDALLLVDEAHLATGLLRTAAAAGERDRCGLPLPGLDIVQMTATASEIGRGGGQRPAFVLDLPAHLAVPEAARRLTAPKRLQLLETTNKNVVTAFAQTALALANTMRTPVAGPTVLVVCNTVDTARAVHTELRTATARDGAPSLDVDLLIGRSRPVDRRGLDAAVQDRYGVGAARGDRPAILVATQTVEVGINLDVDALITESAPWDAVVQRLGRLNRLGRLADRFPAVPAAPAVVVHDSREDGPVYGAARDVAWSHLCTLIAPATSVEALAEEQAAGSGIDVSPARCRDLTRAVPPEAYLAPAGVPILTTPILDQWARTAPEPLPDPPVEPYLHGFASASPAVTVAWRSGLLHRPHRIDLDDQPTEVAAQLAGVLLSAAPIRPGEEVEVPLVAVRRWVAGQRVTPIGDLDVAGDAESAGRPERQPFLVLAWREDVTVGGRWEWVDADGLRPGDRLVVPCERGGLDRYGWDSSSTGEVADVAEAAALDAGGLLLRLDADLPHRLGLPRDRTHGVSRLLRAVIDQAALSDPSIDEETEPLQDENIDNLRAAPGPVRRPVEALIDALIDALAGEDTDPTGQGGGHGWALPARRDELTRLLRHARRAGEPREPLLVSTAPDTVLYGSSGRSPDADLTLLAWRPPTTPAAQAPTGHCHNTSTPPAAPRTGDLERDDDDVTASSVGPDRVPLDRHHHNVRARAAEIAQRLRLPADLIAAVADAAGWHDLGKVEDRFQVMLHGGDPHEAAVADEPLAKSGMDPRDHAAWSLARQRSRLPAGARHEAWSTALVAQYLRDRDEPYPYDGDLVLHLVASHHGHSRPLLPLVVDDDPRPVAAQVDGTPVCVSSAITVDLNHPGRFARLNQRYGRWGLALLESVVRAADTTVSAEGS